MSDLEKLRKIRLYKNGTGCVCKYSSVNRENGIKSDSKWSIFSFLIFFSQVTIKTVKFPHFSIQQVVLENFWNCMQIPFIVYCTLCWSFQMKNTFIYKVIQRNINMVMALPCLAVSAVISTWFVKKEPKEQKRYLGLLGC